MLLLTTPVMAQEPPSEEVKKAALMRAYEANGNSMVGWGAYDATVRVIKTERVIVPTPPEKKVEKVAQLTVAPPSNVCTRHGLRKVISGRSWHCRR